jgi:predicted anti-sigma-YlaC factor YlaD
MRQVAVLTVLEAPFALSAAIPTVISTVTSAAAFLPRVKDGILGVLGVVVAVKPVLEEVKAVLLVAKEIVIIIGELVVAVRDLFQVWAQGFQGFFCAQWLQWVQWAKSIQWIYKFPLLILSISQWTLLIK